MLFDRIFITGVSPIVMRDITSGCNIAENIYADPLLNDMCGFTHAEMEQAVRDVVEARQLNPDKMTRAHDMTRTYYDGYKFSPDADETVYNPTMALYFLKAFY